MEYIWVIYTHNGTLFGLEKEGNPEMCSPLNNGNYVM